MRVTVLAIFLGLGHGDCWLWPKGVVHYTINKKDYDIHSQDVIMTAFGKIEKEVCVKFFNSPFNYNTTQQDKILYISNPDKKKTCSPIQYNYEKSVVDMPIGYKCLNERDIARMVVEMLRSSIDQAESPVSSYDLLQKYHEMNKGNSNQNLLSPADRNYINVHYQRECGALEARKPPALRTDELLKEKVSQKTQQFYHDKLWPLGIVMYSVDSGLENKAELSVLRHAMSTIERGSCVVFLQHEPDKGIEPNNLLHFGVTGEDDPQLGFSLGNQTIKLSSMVHGDPGHNAHALNNLMRVLGVPMVSNRYDRDNYVTITWKNVVKGREHLLERLPEAASFPHIGYDFDSVTHAPANYVCDNCDLGSQTVTPVQDHLWQKTLSMGHRIQLSDSDKQILKILYERECGRRFLSKDYVVDLDSEKGEVTNRPILVENSSAEQLGRRYAKVA